MSGGRDCGFQSVTMSILCDKCKEIFDVQIGEVTDDDDTIDRHAKEATCPECHSHDVIEWKEPHPCPHCGKDMEHGDIALFWD